MKFALYILLSPFVVIGFLGGLVAHGCYAGWCIYETLSNEVFE